MTDPVLRLGLDSLDRGTAEVTLTRLSHCFQEIGPHAPVVVLDLAGLHYLDAAGGRCLLAFWAEVAKNSQTCIRLANVSSEISPALARCKLDHLFDVIPGNRRP